MYVSELVPQVFNQTANISGIDEIKRLEIEPTGSIRLQLCNRCRKLLALVPRYRNDPVPLGDELARDAES